MHKDSHSREASVSLSADTDEWLNGYVREQVGGYPASEVLEELLASAPFGGGPVFRGMNFKSKEAFDEFVEQTSNFTSFESDNLTSWTKLPAVAGQFCLTRPTYELNRDLMRDQAKCSQDRDFMIGYAGVVLRQELQAGEGIDVTRTRRSLGEGEVLLPPGKYRISLERVEVPFSRAISQDNVGEHLDRMNPLDLSQRDMARYIHIINRFTDFTDNQRRQLFRIAAAVNGKIDAGAAASECHDRIGKGPDKMTVFHLWADIPDEYVSHYEKFLPEDQVAIDALLQKIVDQVDEQFAEVSQGFDWQNRPFEVLISSTLKDAVNSGRIEPDFAFTINDGSSQQLRYLLSDVETRRINNLDPDRKYRAMAVHGEKVAHAMRQRIVLPSMRRKLNQYKSDQGQSRIATMAP